MAYSLLSGAPILQDLIGVAAGHTYIFLKDILPNSHRINILRTPKFLYIYIHIYTYIYIYIYIYSEKLVNKYLLPKLLGISSP